MDATIRDLERRARTDFEAAVRLTIERYRAGALTRARIELATFLGDSLGHAVLREIDPPSFEHRPVAGGDWFRELSMYGHEPALRGALIAHSLATSMGGRPMTIASSARATTEQWLECPCAEHAKVVLTPIRDRFAHVAAAVAQLLSIGRADLAAREASRESWAFVRSSLTSVGPELERDLEIAVARDLARWAIPRP